MRGPVLSTWKLLPVPLLPAAYPTSKLSGQCLPPPLLRLALLEGEEWGGDSEFGQPGSEGDVSLRLCDPLKQGLFHLPFFPWDLSFRLAGVPEPEGFPGLGTLRAKTSVALGK